MKLPKFKSGEILSIESESKSFAWNDGLAIVIKVTERGNLAHICKIDSKGNPSLTEDGKYSVFIAGSRNPGLKRTCMKYKLDNNLIN